MTRHNEVIQIMTIIHWFFLDTTEVSLRQSRAMISDRGRFAVLLSTETNNMIFKACGACHLSWHKVRTVSECRHDKWGYMDLKLTLSLGQVMTW